jgi:predicted ATPase/DNA-binding CsgD family transcriptional regulator
MRGALGNVPQELTSLVGRRNEVTEVKRLVLASRLVTLVGAGGVGKTRLALRVAEDLGRRFRHGVWLIELDRVRDEALVVPSVVAALGLREGGQDSAVALLKEFLADRQVLLVLDNCEHLVGSVAALAAELLRSTADLRILATSREPLAIAGERNFPVPPLAAPDPLRPLEPGDTAPFDAVTLFVARGAAVMPGFALTATNQAAIAEICHVLDGVPLALELAAVRLRALSPAQIRDRLSQGLDMLRRSSWVEPSRQRTMSACIAWSYDLCTPSQQQLWARLSVFVGDVDLPTVEAVCAGDPLPAGEILDLVTSLVDQSILIRREEAPGAGSGVARYRMLETLRTFGQERLAESGEEPAVRRRHRDWFRRLARDAEADLVSARQAEWLLRLERELPDLRAALEYSLAEPDGADVALGMTTSLVMLWSLRGLHSEGRHWVDLALARPGAPGPDRVRALVVATTLGVAAGDLTVAGTRAGQLRETAARLGDPHSLAHATNAHAILAIGRGDLAAAAALSEEALAGLRGGGDLFWQAATSVNLILTYGMLGDTAAAMASYEALMEICRPRGELWFSGFADMALGIERWKAGDQERAAAFMASAARLLRHSGNLMFTSWCLEVTAWIAADGGRPERAAVLLGAAAGLADFMGTRAPMWPDLLVYHAQREERTRSSLGEQGFRRAFTRGQDLALDDAVAYALEEPPGHDRAPDGGDGGGTTPAPDAGPLEALTPREREVADLIAKALTNKEIADRLVISQRTAEGHVQRIMVKLGCRSRIQVAAQLAQTKPARPTEKPNKDLRC